MTSWFRRIGTKGSVLMKRTAFLAVIVFVGVCLQCFLVASASAHHIIITASASCVNGATVISFTATSWTPGGIGGSNSEIDILFDGVKVFSGAFTPASGQFTGQQPAPSATNIVTVKAVAIADWDDGFLA